VKSVPIQVNGSYVSPVDAIVNAIQVNGSYVSPVDAIVNAIQVNGSYISPVDAIVNAIQVNGSYISPVDAEASADDHQQQLRQAQLTDRHQLAYPHHPNHCTHTPPATYIHRVSKNKSPAVARVSRPYSRCTLATCLGSSTYPVLS